MNLDRFTYEGPSWNCVERVGWGEGLRERVERVDCSVLSCVNVVLSVLSVPVRKGPDVPWGY